jgi:hypothetical protein
MAAGAAAARRDNNNPTAWPRSGLLEALQVYFDTIGDPDLLEREALLPSPVLDLRHSRGIIHPMNLDAALAPEGAAQRGGGRSSSRVMSSPR